MSGGRTLALETTGPAVSVAVAGPDGVLARTDVLVRAASSELVVQLVDELLTRTRTHPGDLERIAVSRGPGGFTGIRVGLATARALGAGWRIPVVSVTAFESSLMTLADHPGAIVVALDARRGQIYAQMFAGDAARSPGTPVVVDPSAVRDALGIRQGDEPAVVVGSATIRYPGPLGIAFPSAWLHRSAGPDAVGVAEAVRRGLAAGRVDPLYIRPPDARLPRQEVRP